MSLFKIRAWLRDRQKLLVLTAITCTAYSGALARESTLLWGAAALLAATLIIGVIWPSRSLRALSVTRQAPNTVTAGDLVTFSITVANNGWLPRYFVDITDKLPFRARLDSQEPAARTTLGSIPFLPSQRATQFSLPVPCEVRGCYTIGPIGLETSFPLGLATQRYTNPQTMFTLIVYPAVFPIARLAINGVAQLYQRAELPLMAQDGDCEFHSLRDYQVGDSPRRVHWPSTARRGTLMVRTFEPQAQAMFRIVLNLTMGFDVGSGKHSTLEYSVTTAASLAHFAVKRGIPFRVVGNGTRHSDTAVGNGEQHYQSVLHELALVQADGEFDYSQSLSAVANTATAGETVFVFLDNRDGVWDTALAALAVMRNKHIGVHAFVFDRASFKTDTVQHHTASQLSTKVEDALHSVCQQVRTVRRDHDLAGLFSS